MKTRVRVRYAPSPTGYQHIGGIRTAIVNYLLAMKLNGTFIIRIEDTDTNRYVAEAEKYILLTLEWLNIPFSEAPTIGGNYGPYRQSERIDIYRYYALQLVSKGHAYYSFESSEELEKLRIVERQKGKEFLYNYKTRIGLNNSLNLTADEVSKRLSTESYTIRLKLKENALIEFSDEVRGSLKVHTSTLEDKILLKSNGWPTYHLASVVDDTLMKISHVVRGEEWLPSAPIHHYLYEVFGWDSTKPRFAHLPLILNPNGKGKLSKRKLMDSDIPIFPLSWQNKMGKHVIGMREAGFLPDAVINILILLGWHDDSNKEIYSRKEIQEEFDFSKIQRSGAAFDYKKALWVNSMHIKKSNTKDIAYQITELFKLKSNQWDNKKFLLTIKFVKNRMNTLVDILEYENLFLIDFNVNKVISLEADIESIINNKIIKELLALKEWSSESISNILAIVTSKSKVDKTSLFKSMRLLVTGKANGLNVADMLFILGKQTAVHRLSIFKSTK